MPFLPWSVRSILEQTVEDLELVILNNGSTDGTKIAAEGMAGEDPRVRVVHEDERLGLVGSANAAMALASGDFVARMDADDIAEPTRLARQLEIFQSQKDVSVVATVWEGIDASGRTIRPPHPAGLLSPGRTVPFPHGSTMIPRALLEDVGGYRIATDGWEDHDLFLRLSRRGRIVVLLEPLYRYRYHQKGSTVTLEDHESARAILDRAAAREAGDRTANHALERKALTEAQVTRAAYQVWAGERPRPRPHVRDAIAARSLNGLARSIIYGWLGSAAPRLVRSSLSTRIRLLNRASARRWRGRRYLEWRFEQ